MKNSLAALATGAALALVVAAAPTGAQAGDRGAVAAGVIGGLAAGAIIGGAIANSAPPPPAYYPAPAYGPGPVYYDEAPECRIVRQRVWIEGLGYRWRNVEMCD